MSVLEGKVAIITGSGRGIGQATATMLAEHGASVVVTDLDPDPAIDTAQQINDAGGTALPFPGDVTAPAYPNQLIQATLDKFGGLDIIINNAGYTWDGVIHKMTDEQWDAILTVHLTAPFRIIRAAAPYLRDIAKQERETQGQARARKIVNVSSVSGTRGNFGQSNYAAAKAGVTGLTRTLAKEWGAFNIQVNAVAFGFIETRLTDEKGEEAKTTTRGEAEIALGIPKNIREMAISMIPLGRPGTPQDAAGPLFFFASPLSDYVSGQVLEVTGGQ